MKITTSGQVSIPAAVRRAWGTTRVKMTLEGDRLVVEPEPENPFDRFYGIFAGPGPTYDELRAEDRELEREREERKWGHRA